MRPILSKDRLLVNAPAGVGAFRYRAPEEQTNEDLQDLLKVWRQRLSPSRSP